MMTLPMNLNTELTSYQFQMALTSSQLNFILQPQQACNSVFDRYSQLWRYALV